MVLFELHNRSVGRENCREIVGNKTRDVTVGELETCGKIQNCFVLKFADFPGKNHGVLCCSKRQQQF